MMDKFNQWLEFIDLDRDPPVTISQPQRNAEIRSGQPLRGTVSGSWFFEGVVPVELTTVEGRPLYTGSAAAQGEWMTENQVQYASQ